MLIQKLKSIVHKMKLREKLFINYLLLSITPLIIISAISYRVSVSNTRETMTDFINLFSSQLSSEIQKYVSSIDNISKSLVNDINALDFLSNEDRYTMSKRITYRRVIDNYIYNMSLQKPDLEHIMVIGDSGYIYHSGNPDLVLDIEIIMEESWFEKIRGSDGNLIVLPVEPNQIGEQSIFIIGRVLMDAYGTRHGIVAFRTQFGNIISTNVLHNQIITSYDIGLEVRNFEGELIYDTDPDNTANRKNVITLSKTTSEYGLLINLFVPEKTLFSKIYVLKNITYSFVVVITILAILLSVFLSYSITKPLSSLAGSMKLIHKQKYVLIPSGNRKDEIGMLTQTYNRMVSKINTLINEVYAAKLKEKQAQFVALQNQINPHMLNNTIENIRMKATLNNDPEVSDMIKMLGRIFHLTLSRNKKNHTIADEVEHINTYISLLNMRHDDRFKLDINIPEKIMKMRIIRFTFQPLVENSIIHGFENHTGECRIGITTSFRGNDIEIVIRDNGTGISSKRLESIRQRLNQAVDMFEETYSSIGLKNVYDRIKLEYGDKYYLKISSAPSGGTTVVMLIPFTGGNDNV